MLDDRKLEVLRAIVEDFVSTTEIYTILFVGSVRCV